MQEHVLCSASSVQICATTSCWSSIAELSAILKRDGRFKKAWKPSPQSATQLRLLFCEGPRRRASKARTASPHCLVHAGLAAYCHGEANRVFMKRAAMPPLSKTHTEKLNLRRKSSNAHHQTLPTCQDLAVGMFYKLWKSPADL